VAPGDAPPPPPAVGRAVIARRGFLGLVSGSAAVAGLVGCGIDLRALIGNGSGQTAELLRSAAPLPEPFRAPLPVPPVRRPVGGLVEITLRVAEVEILPGTRTTVLGYDGIFPGPAHRGGSRSSARGGCRRSRARWCAARAGSPPRRPAG